jgi:hypothetical protein
MKRQRSSWLSLSFNAWQAGLEAQQVIGLRLAKLAGAVILRSSKLPA